MISKRIVGKAICLIALACAMFLAACAPANEAVLASTPEPTPAATPTLSPAPTPTVTPSPTASPEPTPTLTKEEAIRKLNITSDMIYCMSDFVVFECTLKTGEVKYLVVYTTFRTDLTGENGLEYYEMLNVTDNETFATFSTDESGWSFINMMDEFEIDLVPEFLQGAIINTTYQFISIPSLYDAIGKPSPVSKWIDYIIETSNTDPDQFHERCYSSLDSVEIILDLIPFENMVWASDYIEGFIEETPEVK